MIALSHPSPVRFVSRLTLAGRGIRGVCHVWLTEAVSYGLRAAMARMASSIASSGSIDGEVNHFGLARPASMIGLYQVLRLNFCSRAETPIGYNQGDGKGLRLLTSSRSLLHHDSRHCQEPSQECRCVRDSSKTARCVHRPRIGLLVGQFLLQRAATVMVRTDQLLGCLHMRVCRPGEICGHCCMQYLPAFISVTCRASA